MSGSLNPSSSMRTGSSPGVRGVSRGGGAAGEEQSVAASSEPLKQVSLPRGVCLFCLCYVFNPFTHMHTHTHTLRYRMESRHVPTLWPEGVHSLTSHDHRPYWSSVRTMVSLCLWVLQCWCRQERGPLLPGSGRLRAEGGDRLGAALCSQRCPPSTPQHVRWSGSLGSLVQSLTLKAAAHSGLSSPSSAWDPRVRGSQLTALKTQQLLH